MKQKGLEQLYKQRTIQNWRAETETERYRIAQTGKQSSIRNWTAETETET